MESSSSALRVEPLKPVHLTWLQSNDQAALLPRLQGCLLRGWLAHAEALMGGLVLSRLPQALVASENRTLRALLLLRPHNRQGSCWRLELQQLTPATRYSQGQLAKELFQLALLDANIRSRSWVVRCSSSDSGQLSVLRELGFQPIRTLRRWRVPTTSDSRRALSWPQGCEWVPLDRRTAPLLWPLDQASTTSLQRQIVDRHPIDLLDQAGAGSGVLLAPSRDSGQPDHRVALAGLVRHQRCDDAQVLELLRAPAWDDRLTQCLQALLADLATQCPQGIVVCNSEDAPLIDHLNRLNWPCLEDELVLGRSLWRRQTSPRLLQATRPLESMLGRLQPQQPPLPTPSLGRR